MIRYLCIRKPPNAQNIPAGARIVECPEYWRYDNGGHLGYVFGAIECRRELNEQELEEYGLEVGD